MGDDDYDAVVKKPLNFLDKKVKHKKKRKKAEDSIMREVVTIPKLDFAESKELLVTTATKAEQAFQSRQAKIAEERILRKASKSHKQRVEEFNKHLDSLSEHYDIPKVSWTK